MAILGTLFMRVLKHCVPLMLLAVAEPAAGADVKDGDGNVYSTVAVGAYEWMAENLRATTYTDGEGIPEMAEDAAWSSSRVDWPSSWWSMKFIASMREK